MLLPSGPIGRLSPGNGSTANVGTQQARPPHPRPPVKSVLISRKHLVFLFQPLLSLDPSQGGRKAQRSLSCWSESGANSQKAEWGDRKGTPPGQREGPWCRGKEQGHQKSRSQRVQASVSSPGKWG